MPTSFHDVIENYFTCEFTTLSRNGSPVTWPVTPRLLADGRFLLTTSIGLPQKAFNIRRNPKVSMLFSDPTGSGVTEPGALLIQGDASAEDRIVTDMSSDPDLETPTRGCLLEFVARPATDVAVLPSHPDLCRTASCILLADTRFHTFARATRSQRVRRVG